MRASSRDQRVPRQQIRGPSRNGKLVIHAMLYVTLTSALLVLGGVCLNTALRADAADQKESQFLSTLMRCEHQFREDATSAQKQRSLQIESSTVATMVIVNGLQVRWVSQRGILSREVTSEGILKAREQFIFPAGSQAVFELTDEGACILRIIEPSAYVKFPQGGDGGSQRSKSDAVANPPLPDGSMEPAFVEIRIGGVR